MPYRAPELFDAPRDSMIDERTDGELRCSVARAWRRQRPDTASVWSLGCTLFALVYGYSPFECEFGSRPPHAPFVVDCTHTRVIGRVPFPPAGAAHRGELQPRAAAVDAPPHSAHPPTGSQPFRELVMYCLTQDPTKRPHVADVLQRLRDMGVAVPEDAAVEGAAGGAGPADAHAAV